MLTGRRRRQQDCTLLSDIDVGGTQANLLARPGLLLFSSR
jgi:hypothetical protein